MHTVGVAPSNPGNAATPELYYCGEFSRKLGPGDSSLLQSGTADFGSGSNLKPFSGVSLDHLPRAYKTEHNMASLMQGMDALSCRDEDG